MIDSKDIRLLHLSNHIHHVLFEQDVMIGGFYNWHLVFQQPNNFVTYTSPDVQERIMSQEFNVILFGISRPEMVADTINRVAELAKINNMSEQEVQVRASLNARQMVRDRKMTDRNTVIVAHVDYAVQLWHSPMLKDYFSPYALRKALEPVDYIFSAEPVMGEWIHHITGRPVWFIPHPTNITALKQIRDRIETLSESKNIKDNAVRVIIHRYDNNWVAPFIVCETSLDRSDPNYPMMIYVAMDGGQNFITELRSLGCEYVEAGTPHGFWLEKLLRTRVIVDSYHSINSYGRSPVEAACMGTPIIGSDVTYLQKILWPKLTTKPNQVGEQKKMLVRLLKDQDFYNEVCDYAYQKTSLVSYDSCRDMFMKMLNGELEPYWR